MNCKYEAINYQYVEGDAGYLGRRHFLFGIIASIF